MVDSRESLSSPLLSPSLSAILTVSEKQYSLVRDEGTPSEVYDIKHPYGVIHFSTKVFFANISSVKEHGFL